ncbi:MAG: symmetrical bis(5'-nucleosyl)-tetraphosphatase [Gammaproteobacteria bacterium]|nr:symmetrical bis(5'-nucleosyl)-tetraphosphatase [Gammaproteobacteria bacterium]
MATYVIGDLQGCLDPLLQLLEQVGFDRQQDRLWFTGDLVNRGPQSLESLRFVKELGDSALTVLGNHDLHLIAVSEGHDKYLHRDDTLGDILAAPDRDELLRWLRHRPLLHYDEQRDLAMVHAGLPPQWTIQEARGHAREVESVLRSDDYRDFLDHMYGNQPDRWQADLTGHERRRFIVNCLTRLRYCSADGRLALDAKGKPGSQPEDTMPWFQAPKRKSRMTRILFGHWSTLGLYRDDNVIALDTGCLWGGSLTAIRLEDGEIFSQDCPQTKRPGMA